MAGDALEGDGSGAGEVRSSTVLRGDLEEVQGKISRYQSRKELTEYPEVKSRGDAVVECYRYASCKLIHLEHFFDMVVGENPATSLNCGKEVDQFKISVAKLEQVCPIYLKSSILVLIFPSGLL